MLHQLILKGYRGFRQHTVNFRHKSIIIGRNNVGKSTIVEALRLLSLVVNRFRNSNYIDMSGDTGIRELEFCIAPSLRGTNIDLRDVCYPYGDPPAILEAQFEGHQRASMYLFPDNEYVAGLWGSLEGRISVLPGKRALGRLSELMRNQFGVSLSPGAVASAMRESEIAEEVRGVLEAIERGERFGPR